GVLLSSNRRLIYKYAASNPDALADRPNDWLVYHCIKMAVDTGHKYFDFGISEKSQELSKAMFSTIILPDRLKSIPILPRWFAWQGK
ncbi:GNAT family N-acetyltransferase, partial [bacterium]|nr:GNAT family N-acetyltransferase [bacterium]